MTRTKILIAALILTGLGGGDQAAEAGCGCDHPPPLRGTVYPRFGSIGDVVSIYSPDITAPVKCVEIGHQPVVEYLSSSEPQTVVVKLPPGLQPGASSITVYDVDCKRVKNSTTPLALIPDSAFTGLPPAIPVLEQEGTVIYDDIWGAVDSEGNLLVPFDISAVREATQFYITIRNLALRFDLEGLNYYNREEYNLKLFEHLVTGPEDYQWGAFYGMTTDTALDPQVSSDTIEYWRHEFYTYAEAHAPGGTHEAGADGTHPDGTLHVDHNNLVLVINGWASSSDPAADPYDRTLGNLLSPGWVTIDVAIGQLFSDTLVPRSELTAAQEAILDGSATAVKSNHGKLTGPKDATNGSYR